MAVEIVAFASTAAARVACPICGAKVGKPCKEWRLVSFHVRSQPHKARRLAAGRS